MAVWNSISLHSHRTRELRFVTSHSPANATCIVSIHTCHLFTHIDKVHVMNALGRSSVAQDGNALPCEQRSNPAVHSSSEFFPAVHSSPPCILPRLAFFPAVHSSMMSLTRTGAPMPLVDLSSWIYRAFDRSSLFCGTFQASTYYSMPSLVESRDSSKLRHSVRIMWPQPALLILEAF